jgi:hypothetical protein
MAEWDLQLSVNYKLQQEPNAPHIIKESKHCNILESCFTFCFLNVSLKVILELGKLACKN